MKRPRISVFALLSWIIPLGVIFLLYHPWIRHPLTHFEGAGDDSIKNIFTVDWHVRHNPHWLYFGAMNYPYGEHMVFTDNQPLLSTTLKAIHTWVYPLTQTQIFQILYLLIFISFGLAGWVLFRLLRLLNVTAWYAAAVAVCIALLTPQTIRMFGHYALAYVVALPAVLLLGLEYRRAPSLWKSLGIGGLLLVFALLHLYYLLMMMFILGLFWLIWIQGGGLARRGKVMAAADFGLQVGLAFVVVQLWMLLTDHTPDRPAYPWGYFAYDTIPDTVLLPFYSPLGQWLQTDVLHNHRINSSEGIVFLGFPAVALLLVGLVRGVRRAFQKRFRQALRISSRSQVNTLFWVGLAALLFSKGLPHGEITEQLLVHLGPLKQFRSIGRFAWITYYCLNLVVFAQIYACFEARRHPRWLRWTGLLLPLCVMIFHIVGYYCHFRSRADVRVFPAEQYVRADGAGTWLRNLDPAPYQAVLTFPPFVAGGEYFTGGEGGRLFPLAVALANQHQLPMAPFMMSRTSARETISQLNWMQFYPSFGRAHAWRQSDPDRDFLLLHDRRPVTESAKRILEEARLLHTFDEVQVYHLSHGAMLRGLQHFYSETQARFKAMEDSLQPDSTDWYVKRPWVAYRSWNHFRPARYDVPEPELTPAGYMRSEGVIYNSMQHGIQLPSTDSVVVSFWTRLTDQTVPWIKVQIQFYDGSGNPPRLLDFRLHEQLRCTHGAWGLFECTLAWPPDTKGMVVFLCRLASPDLPFYVDQFMVRTPDQDGYRPTPEGIFHNNRFYEDLSQGPWPRCSPTPRRSADTTQAQPEQVPELLDEHPGVHS